MTTTTNKAPEPTAIKSVGYYTASPVECCDRCGQGIKHVFPVHLKDGTVFKYGSECINKVLAGDTTLKSLWRKNAKRLQELKHHIEVLSRPVSEMPKGFEYFNSGIFIIIDDNGKSINGSQTGSILFHPEADEAKNAASQYPADGRQQWDGKKYIAWTPEARRAQALEKIESAKAWINSEIARIEPFLARILAKGLAGQPKPEQAEK